jgi:6-phosphogluconolactonase
MTIIPEIKVMRDLPGVARETADRIVEQAGKMIALQGKFSLALSGGSTPKALYSLLSGDDYRDKIDWASVHLYFGDERCVPPDSAESNYRMARETLLDRAPIPPANVHRIRGEIDPHEAAKEYGELLKADFGDGGIDLTLLGMGDDGHTASLFPHTEALKESKHRCAANWVEKMKTWRVTMTYPFLNRSESVIIMVAGASKASRVEEILQGPRDSDRLPIQGIAPQSGKLTWILDAAAAAMEQD